VLSSYTTSAQGELLVSTFIGPMHPDHPMSAEVLPVLFSWHLGVALNKIAGSWRGAFEPGKFWTAWDRGAATSVDVLDPGWDFWAATEWPLAELRPRTRRIPHRPRFGGLSPGCTRRTGTSRRGGPPALKLGQLPLYLAVDPLVSVLADRQAG
jgi:hypothetical protein